MNPFLGTSRLRLCLIGLGAAVLIAGCADKATTRPPVTSAQRTVAARPSAEATVAASQKSSRSGETVSTAHSESGLPEQTGVSACDDYLASYRACHRAANIYAPSDIEHRYELMRKSLLHESLDPASHNQMAARCNALATSLRDALHGKTCQPLPAEAQSSQP